MRHYALGTLYRLQEKNDLAIQEYQKALNINPKDVLAHVDLATIYRTEGTLEGGRPNEEKLDLAASELEKAVKLNPRDIDLLNVMNSEYIEIGSIYSEWATNVLLNSDPASIDFGTIQNYNKKADYYFKISKGISAHVRKLQSSQ